MKKTITIFILVISILFSCGCTAKQSEQTEETKLKFYEDIADNLDIINEYYTEDLSTETLESRAADGKIIIEKVIGIVENAEDGTGRVLNTENPDYWYISYDEVEGIHDGDIILSIFIYNPDNNEIDDIIARFDYIIDGE